MAYEYWLGESERSPAQHAGSTVGVKVGDGIVSQRGRGLVKTSDVVITLSSKLGTSDASDALRSLIAHSRLKPGPSSLMEELGRVGIDMSPSSLCRISWIEGPSEGSSVTGSPCHGTPDRECL